MNSEYLTMALTLRVTDKKANNTIKKVNPQPGR